MAVKMIFVKMLAIIMLSVLMVVTVVSQPWSCLCGAGVAESFCLLPDTS